MLASGEVPREFFTSRAWQREESPSFPPAVPVSQTKSLSRSERVQHYASTSSRVTQAPIPRPTKAREAQRSLTQAEAQQPQGQGSPRAEPHVSAGG